MKIDKLISVFAAIFIAVYIILPKSVAIHNRQISTDIMIGVIFILFLIKYLFNKNNRNQFRNQVYDFCHDKLSILFIIVMLIMFVSIFYSKEKTLALSETLRFLSYVLLMFLVKYNLSEDKKVRGMFRILVLSIFAICLCGIYQHFTGFALSKEFIENYEFGAKNRIAISFGNPNSISAFLLLFIFPIIMVAIETKNVKHKISLGIVVGLMVVNIIMTYSRNAWVALAIGIAILAFVRTWKFIIAYILIGIASLKVPAIYKRIGDFFNMDQNVSRLKHWKVAILMIKDHPLFGVGNGNYISNYGEYIKKHPELDYANLQRFPSHNSYLKIISELGIIGGIPFILLLIICTIKIKYNLKFINDKIIKSYFLGFFVSAICFLIMNFVDNLFFVPKVAIWFWLMFAVCEGLVYTQK